jgi:pimeloyl-ACP methyl ester carboxylesterase
MKKIALALLGSALVLTPGCVPYTQDEVAIRVNDEVTLAGTLSIPEGQGPFPAVILISGSGLQTRNHDVWGFPMFKKLADQLTRRSIAVLRCDDRGYGRSSGNGSGVANNTLDFVDDALAQVNYLQDRPEVDSTRIGVLGISEGALVASMADARSDDIEFAILLAGPAVPVVLNLSAQLESNLRRKGIDEQAIAAEVDVWNRIYATVNEGGNLSPLHVELREVLLGRIGRLPPDDQAKLGDIEQYAESRAEKNIRMITSKWGRFLAGYDPREDQAAMAARVLALYGGKDSQVPADLNAPALERTFREVGKSNYTIRVFDEANHLFQEAVSGNPDEYEDLPPEFLPGFLGVVEDWIKSSGDESA